MRWALSRHGPEVVEVCSLDLSGSGQHTTKAMSTAHWHQDCCSASPGEAADDGADPNRPVLLRAGADEADPNPGVLAGNDATPKLAKPVVAAAEDGCNNKVSSLSRHCRHLLQVRDTVNMPKRRHESAKKDCSLLALSGGGLFTGGPDLHLAKAGC